MQFIVIIGNHTTVFLFKTAVEDLDGDQVSGEVATSGKGDQKTVYLVLLCKLTLENSRSLRILLQNRSLQKVYF